MAESLDTPLETTRRPRWLWQRSNEQSDGFGRFAEATARFMGSPKFILYMTIFVVTWIVLNVVLVQYARKYAWDAYPFILLNLAFSTQASYSAPLILLAQNRQDDRERVVASEDRKRYGLVLQQDVAANTVLPSLKKFSTGGLLQDGRMRKAAGKWVKTLATKTPSVRQQARNLSGGNQQKVVLAKWLERDCDILIFDEPTRGIDVGAKQEIYDLLDELTDQGKSIIMISSEMEEVLRMSDRIAVMCNGRITGFLPNAEATQEKIMELATQFTTTETTSEAN